MSRIINNTMMITYVYDLRGYQPWLKRHLAAQTDAKSCQMPTEVKCMSGLQFGLHGHAFCTGVHLLNAFQRVHTHLKDDWCTQVWKHDSPECSEARNLWRET